MAKIICPHCGHPVTIQVADQPIRQTKSRSQSTSFESSQRPQFPNAAAVIRPQAETPTGDYYREAPVHLPTQESHVLVPFRQAIITGFFVGPVVGTAATVFIYNFGDLTIWGSLLFGSIFGAGSFFVAAWWTWSSKVHNYDKLLWYIEEFFNRDEEPPPATRNLSVTVRDSKSVWYADLAGDEKDLYNFAHAVTNGVATFSEEGASQCSYSVRDFRKLRGTFLTNNWCVWNNERAHQQGLTLTPRGKSILRQIANEQPSVGDRDPNAGMSAHYVERGSDRESWA